MLHSMHALSHTMHVKTSCWIGDRGVGDVDNGEFAIDHTADLAFVHIVHSCFNSLDDVSDVRC